MATFYVSVEEHEDVEPPSFAYLKMENNGVVTAVDLSGHELDAPGYTVNTLIKAERLGLLREVSEKEAAARLAPGRDRPKTDADSW